MNAAFTIWYNDLVILDMWLKYYGRYFDYLFILCSATKDKYLPELEERKKIYNLGYKQVNDMTDPTVSNGMVMQTQAKLLKKYNWVLFTNCDEVIAADPRKYKDLRDLMNKRITKYIPCEAFDIVEINEPPIDFTKPLLKQRTYWIKNPNLNKIILSRIPLEWNAGQHQILTITADESKAFKNTGLYLIHLRHFNLKDDEKHPRDFGPFYHRPEKYILDMIDKGVRQKIPEWVKKLI